MTHRAKYHCAVCGAGVPSGKWGKHIDRCRLRRGTRKRAGVAKPPMRDSQTDDLLTTLADRGIHSRGDLESWEQSR